MIDIKTQLKILSKKLKVNYEVLEKRFNSILEENPYISKEEAIKRLISEFSKEKKLLISNLIPGIKAIIEGLVIYKSQILESKNGKKYGYIKLKGDSIVKVFFWEEKLNDFNKINVGDKIRIKVYTKKGKYSLICNYEGKLEILGKEEIVNYKKEYVGFLRSGNYEIEGVVLEVKKNKFKLIDVYGEVWVSYNGIINEGDYVVVKGIYDGKNKLFIAEKVFQKEIKC